MAGLERREGRAMGSPLRLQALAPAGLVDAAWRAVTAEFETTEQALSRFRADSEIELARRAGGHVLSPSRRLTAALTIADRARRMTGGRFDPRVVVDLERLGSDPLRVGGGPAVARTADPSGPRAAPLLERHGRRGPISIPAPVDFGGIGKGLALRWAATRTARILGDRPFLLDAGGDLVGQGSPDPLGWRVGIEDPAGDAEPLAVIVAARPHFSIATSSTRLARWRDARGRHVHHLIDPRTGEPGGAGMLAVTVAGADPAWVEVWSKALFLEGDRHIAGVARRHGLAAWWVTVAGGIEMTPAARCMTPWVRAEAA